MDTRSGLGSRTGSMLLSVLVAGSVTLFSPSALHAQDTSDAPVEDGMPSAGKRYELVRAGDDILRIDREAGSVSFCRKTNDIWRCMPAPLAEEAYQAEISSLSDEIDRLEARIQELETGRAPPPDAGSVPTEQTEKQPDAGDSETGGAVTQETDPTGSVPDQPNAIPKDDPSPAPLSDEEEQDLEKMLQFSEKAMRRFFGLMKDLKDELDQESGN